MWIQIINLNKHDFEEAALISNFTYFLTNFFTWVHIRKTATFCGNLRNGKVMNYLSIAVCSYAQGGETIIRVWWTYRKPESRHGGQRAVDKQKRLKEGGQDPRIKGIRAWNDRDGWSIKWRLEPVRHEGYPTGGRRGKPLIHWLRRDNTFRLTSTTGKPSKRGDWTTREHETKWRLPDQKKEKDRQESSFGTQGGIWMSEPLGPCHDRRRERERHDLSTRATASILRRQ